MGAKKWKLKRYSRPKQRKYLANIKTHQKLCKNTKMESQSTI